MTTLKPLMRRFSLAVLDESVLRAVGLPFPTELERDASPES
jgi:hypothetical protein